MPVNFQARRRAPSRTRRWRGFTLVEMRVTIVVTLLIVLSMVRMFEWIGTSVADGRGAIELAGMMRSAASRLQQDLEGVTVPVRPWPELGSAEGYFEIVEGPVFDGATAPADTLTGDLDDLIMFTAFSVGEPFTGQVLGQLVTNPATGRLTLICNPANPLYNAAAGNTTTITSSTAEIIWWTRFNDDNGDGIRNQGEVQTLHRRMLLIRPDIDTTGLAVNSDPTVTTRTPAEFFNSFDLSARRILGGSYVTNSLSDLTQRENRFAHAGNFPFPLNPALVFAKTDLTWASAPGLLSAQRGEDVILSHVLSFDVRVYDQAAQRLQYNGQIVSPGDPGWTDAKNAGAGTLEGVGAYVDLFYSRMLSPAAQTALPVTDFSGRPNVRSQLQATPTYDTWSFSYERDGIDQNGNAFVDEGTDGLDNDNANGTDDVGERETSPPYPVPLRGIRITIRAYEPDTRQVRQQSVISKFVPE